MLLINLIFFKFCVVIVHASWLHTSGLVAQTLKLICLLLKQLAEHEKLKVRKINQAFLPEDVHFEDLTLAMHA